MNTEDLKIILNNHQKWLNGQGGERANLQGTDLRGANLQGTDLRGANLQGTDLRWTDLKDAYLWSVRGNNLQIKSLHITPEYDIVYTTDRLQIGCENHSHDEWRGFDDRRIIEMDGKDALKWWRKHKDLIFSIIESCPADSC